MDRKLWRVFAGGRYKDGWMTVRVETECWRGKLGGRVGEALVRASGATPRRYLLTAGKLGVKDSRRGTRGQLVGGTVEVQLAGISFVLEARRPR